MYKVKTCPNWGEGDKIQKNSGFPHETVPYLPWPWKINDDNVMYGGFPSKQFYNV